MDTPKKTLADLNPVEDTIFNKPNTAATPLAVSLSLRTGVKDTRPYHVLDFLVSRGESRLSYSVFARENDVTALSMLGLKFPPPPAPVQATITAATVAAVTTTA